MYNFQNLGFFTDLCALLPASSFRKIGNYSSKGIAISEFRTIYGCTIKLSLCPEQKAYTAREFFGIFAFFSGALHKAMSEKTGAFALASFRLIWWMFLDVHGPTRRFHLQPTQGAWPWQGPGDLRGAQQHSKECHRSRLTDAGG